MTTPSRQSAVPPSEDVMFMNQRQLRNHFHRNQPSGPSSRPVPPQPPRYPHAQPRVPNVPVIRISSSSDRHMTPSELDQAGEDYFGTALSGQNRFTRRDPVQQDESFPRITTSVPAEPADIQPIRPQFIHQQQIPIPPPLDTIVISSDDEAPGEIGRAHV